MGAGGGKTQTGQHCTENSLAPVLAKVRLHRTSTCLYRDAVFPSLSQMPASVPCVQATPSSPPFLQLSLGTRAGPGFSLLQGQLGFGDRDKQEVTPPPVLPHSPPPHPVAQYAEGSGNTEAATHPHLRERKRSRRG